MGQSFRSFCKGFAVLTAIVGGGSVAFFTVLGSKAAAGLLLTAAYGGVVALLPFAALALAILLFAFGVLVRWLIRGEPITALGGIAAVPVVAFFFLYAIPAFENRREETFIGSAFLRMPSIGIDRIEVSPNEYVGTHLALATGINVFENATLEPPGSASATPKLLNVIRGKDCLETANLPAAIRAMLAGYWDRCLEQTIVSLNVTSSANNSLIIRTFAGRYGRVFEVSERMDGKETLIGRVIVRRPKNSLGLLLEPHEVVSETARRPIAKDDLSDRHAAIRVIVRELVGIEGWERGPSYDPEKMALTVEPYLQHESALVRSAARIAVSNYVSSTSDRLKQARARSAESRRPVDSSVNNEIVRFRQQAQGLVRRQSNGQHSEQHYIADAARRALAAIK